MKVSNRIIAGFLILMLLAIIVFANQLSAIHRMQTVNRELADIDMNAARTALHMEKLEDVITDDTKRYFVLLDPVYDGLLAGSRNDFLEDIENLQKTARYANERDAITRLREALDTYWA